MVEKEDALFQALQQLLDVRAQLAGILLGAPILLVQEAEFRLDISEFASFAGVLSRSSPKLAAANQIDALAYTLQRIDDQVRQHRPQKDGYAQRQGKGQ